MVNEDIVGGLKLALSKGETLKSAMMTFFNSGYKKEDIEWAAKSLQFEQTSQAQPLVNQPKKVSAPGVKEPLTLPAQTSLQKISSYEEKKPKPPGRFLIVILVILLAILFGALTTLFLFKDQIIGLFGG